MIPVGELCAVCGEAEIKDENSTMCEDCTACVDQGVCINCGGPMDFSPMAPWCPACTPDDDDDD